VAEVEKNRGQELLLLDPMQNLYLLLLLSVEMEEEAKKHCFFMTCLLLFLFE
jgi:hypothetical protein